MVIGMQKAGFTLPPNIPSRLIYNERKKLWTPKMKEASKATSDFITSSNRFVSASLGTALRQLYCDETTNTGRISKIREALLPLSDKEPICVEFNGMDEKEKYGSLKEECQRIKKMWETAHEEVKPLYKEVYLLFKSLKDEYAQFLDEHRLDPDSMDNPHPSNIRVLAAISQLSGSKAPDEGERISIHVQLISQLLQDEDSIDALIKKAEETVFLIDAKHRAEPHIQKPLSTPNRQNANCWRKSDNNNPNVRRIAIFIPTEDGSGTFLYEMDELIRNYRIQTPAEFSLQPDPKLYRVDRVIKVLPPTVEEELDGVTQSDKIRKAFKEAEEFVRIELEHADRSNNPISFEGIAHWIGHGMYKEEAGPQEGDDRLFLEGSREFFFITKFGENEPEGLDESAIKELERKHLRDFCYFVNNIGSCGSGAMIS